MGLSNITDENNGKDNSSDDNSSQVLETKCVNINKKSSITCHSNISNEKNTSDLEGKMERLLMRCRECEEPYSDERVPRNLTCGHSLCTKCLEKCLSNTKLCTECNEKQFCKTASDQPINYPLLRFIRSILQKEIEIKDIIVPHFPVLETVCDKYQDAGQCPIHSSPMVFLCVSCSVWICQECLVVDHPYVPRGSCKILNLKAAMEQIRKEHKRNVDLVNADIELIHKNFGYVKNKNNLSEKLGCCGERRSHVRLAQMIENGLEDLKKEDENNEEKCMKQIQKLCATADTTTSPEEITLCCKELLDCMDNLKQYVVGGEERRMPVLQNINIHVKMDLKCVVTRNQLVYAVREEFGKKRYSLITCRENRLVIYSLKEEEPPTDSIIVPYEYVQELMPQENATVFFEIGSSEEIHGRVYVRLNGNNVRTKQTCLLCIGEKGPCYRNTCFYNYDDELGKLEGGDFQNNDGTGGRGILRGVEGYDNCDYFKEHKGAFVLDHRLMSQFYFRLKDVDDYSYVVGVVKYGIEILVSASKAKPVTSIVVKDCGFFIPMPRYEDDDDDDSS